MKRIKNRRNKTKFRLLILGCLFSSLILLSYAYSAFSTTIIVNSKGNVKYQKKTVSDLKQLITTTGDGLYKDTTEEDRYIYRGSNPNNYIKLGDDMYRIISIESDNTLKVMKNESVKLITFDGTTNRYETGTYCTGTYKNEYAGCNVWGSINTVLDKNGNNVTTWPNYYGSTDYYKLPSKETEINTYLNTTWYDNLSDDIKNIIVNHSFNIGGVDTTASDTSIKMIYEEESMYKWKGNIALINIYDYMNSSSSDECRKSLLSNWEGRCDSIETCTCATNNYIGTNQRTITPVRNDVAQRTTVTSIYSWGSLVTHTALITSEEAQNSLNYKPAFYLNSNIAIKGNGTLKTPYQVVN